MPLCMPLSTLRPQSIARAAYNTPSRCQSCECLYFVIPGESGGAGAAYTQQLSLRDL